MHHWTSSSTPPSTSDYRCRVVSRMARNVSQLLNRELQSARIRSYRRPRHRSTNARHLSPTACRHPLISRSLLDQPSSLFSRQSHPLFPHTLDSLRPRKICRRRFRSFMAHASALSHGACSRPACLPIGCDLKSASRMTSGLSYYRTFSPACPSGRLQARRRRMFNSRTT